jgi:chromosome segregation ATPase
MDLSGVKKYAAYAGAGLAVIIAFIAFSRACKLDDAYSRLEGRYQEALRIARIDAEILNQTIAEKEKAIAVLDKKLVTSSQVITDLNTGIGKKSQELEALDAKLATAQSDSERVPVLTAQVKAWAEKFNLAEQSIAEKDKQIAAWESKFNAQVEISAAWKQQFENEARLHGLSRDELSALKSKLRATRLMGTVKSGLVLAAVGYIGYQAIKGK